jgi:hypothetical protein
MKNIFYLLLYCSASLLHAQIGIEGSVGMGNLKGIKLNNQKFKPLSAESQVGAFYRWHKAGFGIKTGLSYGTTTLIFDSIEELNIQNVQIPAEFHFIANPKDKKSLYGLFGIGMKIPVDGDKAQLEKVNVAGLLGVGYQLKAGKLTFLPEIGYHFGVTKYTKATFNTNVRTYTSTEESGLNTFIFKLGIGI